MLHLLSYTDKELTNSLLLASDYLTISVCVICFDKDRLIEKSNNMTSKIPLLLKQYKSHKFNDKTIRNYAPNPNG